MRQLDLGLSEVTTSSANASHRRVRRGILAKMTIVAPTLAILPSERSIVRAALDLGARNIGGSLSESERALARLAEGERAVDEKELDELRTLIRAGEDPLGALFSTARSPHVRRANGAFYTPAAIVDPMVAWALSQNPRRVVDAGCGSGRFAAAVARARPDMPIVAIDLDPLATLMTRATLAVLEASAVTVLQADYMTVEIGRSDGRTAWIGNPPYVRHHELAPNQKAWAATLGELLGHRTSGLSGLHAHFFLATASKAAAGDVGCFVTSAEWLDVGWGSIIRHLLLNGLGGLSLDLIEPRAVAFDDAMTTAVIVAFEVGAKPSELRLSVRSTPVALGAVGEGDRIARPRLEDSPRWTQLMTGRGMSSREGLVPLGSIARVHRGIATGANSFFVMPRDQAVERGLEQWAHPAITRASEIFNADGEVRDEPGRRVIIDVPSRFNWRADRSLVSFLQSGKQSGANLGYIARHRTPWWRLGVGAPPPIVGTYMARRPPAFALNPDGLVPTNVAHGIYPIRDLDETKLRLLVERLNAASASFVGNGRTYHGGLEKFEPREMESLFLEWD
jgi:adenine-specific DNA-methyltransferase